MSPRRVDAASNRGTKARQRTSAPETGNDRSKIAATKARKVPAAKSGAGRARRAVVVPPSALKGAPSKVDHTILVELLAMGHTSAQAAAKLRVSSKTVSRHRNDPAVRVALEERQAELVRDIAAKIAAHGFRAVEVLVEGMDGDDPRQQHHSAKALLDRILPFRRGAELEERMLRVERATRTDVPAASDWPGAAS